MHATYFEGNHKYDPGWYINGNGPYLTKFDAEKDAERGALHKTIEKLEDQVEVWKIADNLKAKSEVKFLVKVERSLRSRLLAISIWLLFIPIFWYGVYKFTTWVIS